MAKKVNNDAGLDYKDDLIQLITDSINKGKDTAEAYSLTHMLDAPTDVKDWVSTGSALLDLVISNRKDGGLPFSKIVEINGLEGSGKTLIAMHVVANTQKMGGIGIYIDTESAFNFQFAEAIGLDLNKLVYIQATTLESIFNLIEETITKIRAKDKDRLVTIVVDSIAASSTDGETEADYGKAGYATGKAIVLSQSMRKITNIVNKSNVLLILNNQLRTKLGVSFGDVWTTSGGKAIDFHASVRIRLKIKGVVKMVVNGFEQVVGVDVEAEIKKNRCGPPFRKTNFTVFFDSGVDDYGSWLTKLKEYGEISQGGSWYTIKYKGEDKKFQSKDWKRMIKTDSEFKQYLYDLLAKKMILLYHTKDSDIDSLIITDEHAEEDGGVEKKSKQIIPSTSFDDGGVELDSQIDKSIDD